MRYHCHSCGKSVTSELPDHSIIRAVMFCPECIEENRVVVVAQDAIKNGSTQAATMRKDSGTR